MTIKFGSDFKKTIGITEDKTVINLTDKKIDFFSLEKFQKDIVAGDSCFICGASPSEKEFNNEHILPNWILRRFNLHEDEITLPNNTSIRYGRFTIPCCVECNNQLGREIEIPVSELTSKGYDNLKNYVIKNGPGLLFRWLCLLFIKTHLKDTLLRFYLDRREPDYKIADLFEWESLHHIHCVARSFYNQCFITGEVLGSLLILPSIEIDSPGNFDYGDMYGGKALFIRMNDITLICILNDSCAALNSFQSEFEKISGPLSPLQIREIFARLVYVNMNLKERPTYYSEFNDKNECFIKAKLPNKIELLEPLQYKFGDIFSFMCSRIIEESSFEDKEYVAQKIIEGVWTFLFNEKGEFIKN
jgi:hypothetical protein